MAKETRKPNRKKILEAARKHQDALQAAGLSSSVIARYENGLKGMESQGKDPSPAAQTLVQELGRVIGEVQAAVRKEFPGNTSFQSVFKAGDPLPTHAQEMLALGRLVAKEMPDYAQNLIKHAIDAASVKHLTYLSDQLEHELGGANPAAEVKALEQQIVEAARQAFEGKPELSAFEQK
jgi:hypothetical protein